MDKYADKISIMIIGDEQVGKTTMIKRYDSISSMRLFYTLKSFYLL